MKIKRRIGILCPNESCEYHNKRFRGNIIRFGTQKNGSPRYKCKSCGKTFGKKRNSMFFRKHLTKEEVKLICKMFAKKMSYRATARATNRHLDTIRGVGNKIADNYHKFTDYFSKDLKLTKKESNSMIEFLKNKKAKSKRTKKTIKAIPSKNL